MNGVKTPWVKPPIREVTSIEIEIGATMSARFSIYFHQQLRAGGQSLGWEGFDCLGAEEELRVVGISRKLCHVSGSFRISPLGNIELQNIA